MRTFAGFRVALSVALPLIALLAGEAGPASAADGTRLKDIVAMQGATSTPLLGYGLVIGLNKTGDKRQIGRAHV